MSDSAERTDNRHRLFAFPAEGPKISVVVDALEIADSWMWVPQAGSEGKSVGAIWAANSLNTRTGRVR